jgi:hypothetical protein
MSIAGWISLWTWIYALGLGSFLVLAVVMVPLGARDVWRLLRAIERESEREREEGS